MNTCTYCNKKETEKEELIHGAVYNDPHSDKPEQEDYAYCEDCANGSHSNAHSYFVCCTQCDREFWNDDDIYTLEWDHPSNPFEERACLRCIKEQKIKESASCSLCGQLQDGYYGLGYCRQCEAGCIANAQA